MHSEEDSPQPAEDARSVAPTGHQAEPAPNAGLGSQLKPQQTSPWLWIVDWAGNIYILGVSVILIF